jgi:hypothetical protein
MRASPSEVAEAALLRYDSRASIFAFDLPSGFPSRTGSIYTACRAVQSNIQPELPHRSNGCLRGDFDDAPSPFVL